MYFFTGINKINIKMKTENMKLNTKANSKYE